MKNSIMKKTWGILLGFGLSLATAAFVLTGCDWDVVEEDDITVTLSDGTAGDAKVLLTLTGTTWKADVNGVGAWVDWKLTGTNSSDVGITNPAAVRNSDTEVEITFSSTKNFNGTVEIEKLYPSMFKTFTAASLTSASVDFVSTPVTLSIGAAASTVTLSDGTLGDNKVTLTLSGATWNAANTWADIGDLWLFNPDEAGVADTPTTVGTRTSNTVAEFAFTGRAYTGAVQIDTNPTYFAKLKALTSIGASGSMAAVSDWVNIVVAAEDSPPAAPTVNDLVTALGGTDKVTVSADNTTVTLKSAVSLTGTGKGFTIPEGVTLVVGTSGASLTLGAGNTYVIDGTLKTIRGQLILNGTTAKITIKGEGSIEASSASGTSPVLTVGSGQEVEITGVTVKGYAGSAQPVIASTGKLTLDGADVTGNTGCSYSYGAGIRINTGGEVILDGGAKVYGNTAADTSTSAKGGGVYLDGGSLHIKNGTVYGTSKWGDTYEEADAVKNGEYELEDNEVRNEAGSGADNYGDAIYWRTAAKVYVTASKTELTSSDDEYVVAGPSGGEAGFATKFTIHASGAQWWNIAAR